MAEIEIDKSVQQYQSQCRVSIDGDEEARSQSRNQSRSDGVDVADVDDEEVSRQRRSVYCGVEFRGQDEHWRVCGDLVCRRRDVSLKEDGSVCVTMSTILKNRVRGWSLNLSN